MTTMLHSSTHVIALSTVAVIGLVFVGLCLLGGAAVVGLFVYGANHDGTLEKGTAANQRWTPDDEAEEE